MPMKKYLYRIRQRIDNYKVDWNNLSRKVGFPLPIEVLLFRIGLTNDQSTSIFDKVNSNRVYALEKGDHTNQLMLLTKENDETSKCPLYNGDSITPSSVVEKRIVLPVDEEIRVIVSSFLNVFHETGYIESAPKCHERVAEVYAISNKRIRLVQRTL